MRADGLGTADVLRCSGTVPPGDLLARIGAICCELECHGYRRVGAALRHQGVAVNWFWQHLYGEGTQVDTLVVSLREPDLAGLTPAYVMTRQYQVLHGEGELHAIRPMQAGVSTTLRQVPGRAYPFFRAMYVSPMVRTDIRRKRYQIGRCLV